MLERLQKLLQNEDGIGVIEFAAIAPFLVLLCLGGFELSRLMLVHMKLEKVSYTINDVVSQQTSITNSQLNQYVSAAAQIMQPFTFSSGGVVFVSSVYQSGTNPPEVKWQYTGGGTLGSSSQVGHTGGWATLPTGFTLNDKDNIIVVEVFYNFTPVFGKFAVGASSIYKRAIFKPRLGSLITAPT